MSVQGSYAVIPALLTRIVTGPSPSAREPGRAPEASGTDREVTAAGFAPFGFAPRD